MLMDYWRPIVVGAAFFLQVVVAFSQDSGAYQIFEVKKKLQMSSSEPIIRDYYVNAGESLGLKSGAIIPVLRRVPLQDAFRADTQKHAEVPVGEIKLIYVERTMSIGRVHTLKDAKSSPVTDYADTFMSGDRLDIRGLRYEGASAAAATKEERKSSEPTGTEKKRAPAISPINPKTVKGESEKVLPTPVDGRAPSTDRASTLVPQPVLLVQ